MYIDRKSVCRRAYNVAAHNAISRLYNRLRRHAYMLRKQNFNLFKSVLQLVVKRSLHLVTLYTQPCDQPFERNFS